ncbi:bifunctional DNA-formamidopyrimidine glycosylase/DNA-(apurinic or apyrimidinic site) lyase [Erysipelothrix sp. HDW6C]|uniref:bifunctional DNA-formamidopyrimidine glycosylase/DNA-(apurinic or apyrimidinic site) lyase n=1 Tax=Erysipelothrix sp. HDW6C TaxID=2714930 RepID=UPI00140C4456|nr:bifunctional DNA-formamidopyrimidine glycosylase/DNA-(apurinic or apyrimidinic site) lyase [Erysipelothrix sp. HDW6C]QIK70209.1 bifunctional DNA-formamidopyrimidine glycosylase/DNA-(apurinic or apyrimidinic site) lyase [Erysipelothrix sp. HDW6C]
MPELPEVETIVRTLEKSLINERIETLDFRYPSLLEADSQYPLESLLGASFVAFHRRGKYLWFEMSNGLHWILHLRMEGKFNLYDHPVRPHGHTHLVIETSHHHIHYLDTRKFSRMAVMDDPIAYLATKSLGFEPWDSQLTGAYLYGLYHKTRRMIKTVLLDQSIIAGIGNIYADEILYVMKIHPETPANRLTRKQCDDIVVVTRNVLDNAIAAGGTTVRSYTSGLNVTGRFQINLNAYGREGESCYRCGTRMERVVVGGRSSVYCPKCQKVKV